MSRKLTEQTFFRYLKCPDWVWFDAHEREKKVHEPLMETLQDEGLVEELQRAILKDRKDVAEVTAEDEEEAFAQTLAFMRDGRQTIYRGTLIDGHWVGHPDVLEKLEGRSLLGNYYYVAADIKRSRELKDEYKFQGCFYAELLQRIQGLKPPQGYIITPDGVALPYLVETFEGEYAIALDGIERILSGQRPPHFLTSGCKQSPWFHHCRSLAESCNDLTLLNRVWREEIERLESINIHTISQLAAVSPHDLSRRLPLSNPERLETMRDQALALQEHRTIIKQKVELPESNVELFFDIESDPLRDIDYLFGILVVENGEGMYHKFFAKSSADLEKMWREFLQLIETYPKAPIYHYGQFEVDVVKRFEARFGSTAGARTALATNLVDLLGKIRGNILFPLSFYSLKDIAGLLGFKWQADDAGGANSVMWFEEFLRTGDEKLLQKIFKYNEDDVRATWLVQAWMKENALKV